MEHNSCETTNIISNSIHNGTEKENAECDFSRNAPMSDSSNHVSAPPTKAQVGLKIDPMHDKKDDCFGCSRKLRREPCCHYFAPKWKLLILAFVSVLVLAATIATWCATSREAKGQPSPSSSLGLLSPGGDGGPVPVMYSGRLIGSPLMENRHAILPQTNSEDDDEIHHHHHQDNSVTPKLSFLIDLMSPIVSEISEREGTNLTDFVASRRNDESIVLKGSPQHNALVWLSHAIVCQENAGNSTKSLSASTKDSSNQPPPQTECASLLSRSQLFNRYSLGTMYFAWNGKSWNDARGWLSYDDSGGIEYPPTAFLSQTFKVENANAEFLQKLPSNVCLWKGVTCRTKVESDRNEGLGGNTYQSNGNESSNADDSLFRDETEEQIVGLDLSGNNLVGHMGDVKELRLLEHLEVFDLSQNHLEGLVPREVGTLEELLSLDISQNLLSGSLPSLIQTNLTKLEVLKVEGNLLMGGLEEFRFAPPCSSWKEFSADCYGDRPRVECPCCTICCGASGSWSSSKSLRGGELMKNETILCQEQVPEE